MLRNILLLLVVMAVGACETDTAPRIGPSAFSGDARVVDGDTLYVDDIKVRLNGIDAPEVGSPYGAAATRALSNIVKDKRLFVSPTVIPVSTGSSPAVLLTRQTLQRR